MTQAAPKRRRGWLRSGVGARVYWFLVIGTWVSVALLGVALWYGHDLPAIGDLARGGTTPLVTLTYADGSELAVLGETYSDIVPVSELPAHLVQAVTAVEDRRFFAHRGIDAVGIVRAAIVNLFAGRVKQGGSTITQQLAKNLFLRPERTLKRKIQEALLALWLEERLSKAEILGLYLNRVYFGAGSWGVEAASRRYFGKSARDLDLAQAAMLAGLLKAPSRYAPTTNPKGARERAGIALGAMLDAGFISSTEAAAARTGSVRMARAQRSRGVRYFADWVLDQVPSFVGDAQRDLTIVTTLEGVAQSAAERAVQEGLAGEGRERGASQAALVAMSPEGAVRAMVGGASYSASPFNRAVNALRQPGSAFKLFVYIAGLEAGLRPDDVFNDEPVEIEGWRPRNYAGTHEGPVTLRTALAHSINSVAVQVSERAGRRQVIDAAARLGITSPLPAHPSIALGTAELRLIELTGAYAAVANGGLGVLAYGIGEIRDGDGQLIYQRAGSGPGRALAQPTVAAITDMLQATIAEGTGRAAALDRPAAGKTGTSQGFRDAWFLGFSADLVAGVWFGNDDASPMRKVTGGTLPARTWRRFMATAHEGLPKNALARSAPDDARAKSEGKGEAPEVRDRERR